MKLGSRLNKLKKIKKILKCKKNKNMNNKRKVIKLSLDFKTNPTKFKKN